MSEEAKLTNTKLITIHRLMASVEWQVLWNLLAANFPLHEAVFSLNASGQFDPYAASKRDGQRDVMLFLDKIKAMPTPATTEDETNI